MQRHMELAANATRVSHLPADVSWLGIMKALKAPEAENGPDADGGATVPDAEPEPDAVFWGARDSLLLLRDEAQAQANRFGLECYPDDAGWGQLDELEKCVTDATAAVERLSGVLTAIQQDRLRRGGRAAPRRSRSGPGSSLSPQDRQIVEALGERGSGTSHDVSARTGIPVYILSARLSELHQAGHLRRTGERLNRAFVYEVVDAAP